MSIKEWIKIGWPTNDSVITYDKVLELDSKTNLVEPDFLLLAKFIVLYLYVCCLRHRT